MNRDDIIRLARESGWTEYSLLHAVEVQRLETFAALVAAAERERMKSEGWRQCAKGQRTTQYCGLLEDSVKAEREACEQVCERRKSLYWMEFDKTGSDADRAAAIASEECATAIRARGESK